MERLSKTLLVWEMERIGDVKIRNKRIAFFIILDLVDYTNNPKLSI
jgi:hypothetical protein